MLIESKWVQTCNKLKTVLCIKNHHFWLFLFSQNLKIILKSGLNTRPQTTEYQIWHHKCWAAIEWSTYHWKRFKIILIGLLNSMLLLTFPGKLPWKVMIIWNWHHYLLGICRLLLAQCRHTWSLITFKWIASDVTYQWAFSFEYFISYHRYPHF